MPKITTVVFAGGTTLLIAGAAVAASLSPSGARMLHMAAAPAASTTMAAAPTSTPVPSAAPSTAPPTSPTSTSKAPKATPSTLHASRQVNKAVAKAPITYTVRRGDTLSGVAAWFKLHGYGELYAANAKVVGANPNLIHPGERITIGTHVMKVQGPA